jgi:hypothetical protein
VVLSLPAKVAVKLHGLFPGTTTDLLGLMNVLLPPPGGIGKRCSHWQAEFFERVAIVDHNFERTGGARE